MIQVTYHKGYSCPIVVCDVCGEIIKAKKGIYVWRSAPELGDTPQDAYFVCKGKCDKAMERKIGQTRWSNIAALPAFLIHNLGLTPTEAKRAADEAEDINFRIGEAT
jgi:hypothetical protein